jgi:hypothetical protein
MHAAITATMSRTGATSGERSQLALYKRDSGFVATRLLTFDSADSETLRNVGHDSGL